MTPEGGKSLGLLKCNTTCCHIVHIKHINKQTNIFDSVFERYVFVYFLKLSIALVWYIIKIWCLIFFFPSYVPYPFFFRLPVYLPNPPPPLSFLGPTLQQPDPCLRGIASRVCPSRSFPLWLCSLRQQDRPCRPHLWPGSPSGNWTLTCSPAATLFRSVSLLCRLFFNNQFLMYVLNSYSSIFPWRKQVTCLYLWSIIIIYWGRKKSSQFSLFHLKEKYSLIVISRCFINCLFGKRFRIIFFINESSSFNMNNMFLIWKKIGFTLTVKYNVKVGSIKNYGQRGVYLNTLLTIGF